MAIFKYTTDTIYETQSVPIERGSSLESRTGNEASFAAIPRIGSNFGMPQTGRGSKIGPSGQLPILNTKKERIVPPQW